MTFSDISMIQCNTTANYLSRLSIMCDVGPDYSVDAPARIVRMIRNSPPRHMALAGIGALVEGVRGPQNMELARQPSKLARVWCIPIAFTPDFTEVVRKSQRTRDSRRCSRRRACQRARTIPKTDPVLQVVEDAQVVPSAVGGGRASFRAAPRPHLPFSEAPVPGAA